MVHSWSFVEIRVKEKSLYWRADKLVFITRMPMNYRELFINIYLPF